MEKAKHSLVRIERVDGETVCLSFTGDDPEELLAMLGDGLAEVLHVYPQHYRGARRLMRRVLRDFSTLAPTLDYFLSQWHGFAIGAVLALSVYGVGNWLGVV